MSSSASISGSGGMIRIDSSRMNEYLYVDKPKLNFFQKLGRTIGKGIAFLGPIGAAVTAIAVPGFGLPLAAGLYGASQIAGTLTATAEAKDAATMQAYQQELAKLQVVTPGLFEPDSASDIDTDFIIPQELNQQTTITILDRQMSQNSAVENFKY